MNPSPVITIQTRLPDGFESVSCTDIHTLCPEPSLYYLQGFHQQPLFISVLLHGNECSGLMVVQRLLQHYQHQPLPRSLWIFVGNVAAAAQSVRTLDGQTDFNRAWPGTDAPEDDTTHLLQSVMDTITADDKPPLFAALDLHNNNGDNPEYGIITQVNRYNRILCEMVGHTAIAVKRPKGICTASFNDICPAVTYELGLPGSESGVVSAVNAIKKLMDDDVFTHAPLDDLAVDVKQVACRLHIHPEKTFGFSKHDPVDVWFESGFERYNFHNFSPNIPFAYGDLSAICAIDGDGNTVTDEIFRHQHGRIFLRRSLMPAMITTNRDVVRQDCLCYLLQDH